MIMITIVTILIINIIIKDYYNFIYLRDKCHSMLIVLHIEADSDCKLINAIDNANFISTECNIGVLTSTN